MNLEAIREKLGYQPVSARRLRPARQRRAGLGVERHRRRHRRRRSQAICATSLARGAAAGHGRQRFAEGYASTSNNGGKTGHHLPRPQGRRRSTAAVFKVAERGYAGDILVLMGVDTDGRTARRARRSSTPKRPASATRSRSAKSKWIQGFDGKSLGDPPAEKWAVKKDGGVFDQFAGATITPRAVVKAVKGGLDFFAAHRQEILGEEIMSDDYGSIVKDGLWDKNVVFAQMLAMCPTMAVTTSGTNGLGMGLATTAVLVVSNMLVVDDPPLRQPAGAHPGLRRADRDAGDAGRHGAERLAARPVQGARPVHRADRGELRHPRPRRSLRLEERRRSPRRSTAWRWGWASPAP